MMTQYQLGLLSGGTSHFLAAAQAQREESPSFSTTIFVSKFSGHILT